MITNLDQLKAMIQYCKDNKVKSLKVGTVEIEISELDFIPEEGKAMTLGTSNTGEYNSETLTDTLEEPTDWRSDPDLFHSSNT